MLAIKALIRWSEAKAGAIVCGCREEHLHFLDLPFYRTGTIAKNPVGDEDVRIIRELIERVDPQQSTLPAIFPIRTERTAFVPRRSSGL